MSALSSLPNVGKVLESYLLRVGIETPEQLTAAGAENAFLRIRTQVDPSACLHMLYGIQGAIAGMPDRLLPGSVKEALRAFYKELQ